MVCCLFVVLRSTLPFGEASDGRLTERLVLLHWDHRSSSFLIMPLLDKRFGVWFVYCLCATATANGLSGRASCGGLFLQFCLCRRSVAAALSPSLCHDSPGEWPAEETHCLQPHWGKQAGTTPAWKGIAGATSSSNSRTEHTSRRLPLARFLQCLLLIDLNL